MSRKASGDPDCYETLGVLQDASTAEISAAFYSLARQYHPDTAEQQDPSNRDFKAIIEAYEVLIDPRRRGEYDRRRTKATRCRVQHPGRSRGPLPSSSVHPPRPAALTGCDIHAVLPVTPEEARHGALCQLRVTRLVRCADCRGLGILPAGPCPRCRATGREPRLESLVIQIPRQVHSGTILTISGQGNEPGGPRAPGVTGRGCLYLCVVIRPCW